MLKNFCGIVTLAAKNEPFWFFFVLVNLVFLIDDSTRYVTLGEDRLDLWSGFSLVMVVASWYWFHKDWKNAGKPV